MDFMTNIIRKRPTGRFSQQNIPTPFLLFILSLIFASCSVPSVAISVVSSSSSNQLAPSASINGGLHYGNHNLIKRESLLMRDMSVEELRSYIEYYQETYRQLLKRKTQTDWNFHTNITDVNSAKRVAAASQLSSWMRAEWKSNISRFDLTILDDYENADLARLFNAVSVLGIAALDDDKLNTRNRLVTEMTAIYASAKVCPIDDQKCDPHIDEAWALEPDLQQIFLNSRNKDDYELLAYIWEKWREVTGRKMRNRFIEYVEVTNEAAVANDNLLITNGGDLWLQPYESDTITSELEQLYAESRPFYEELHGFVRHKLRQHYGADKIEEDGPIPAHLLGNMWAQEWQAIFPIVSEFGEAATFDVTDIMQKQNFTVPHLFELADDFFKGLGMIGLDRGSPSFYKTSMLQKPTDGREVLCHAFAWDFMATDRLPGDFRIKQCSKITMVDLITAHHEMGHVQYYMAYVQQPPLFRDGANPGFHEAIGDVIALSVTTPTHLKRIGLLDKDFHLDENAQLAFLLRTALERFAFLPFSYIVDLYRLRVFDGSIPMDKLNQGWWDLRFDYQGLIPPVKRTEKDFDPGAKFHVPNDVQYLKYFVARILQFQFHQALCEAAGQFDPHNPDAMPLHECDIAGSKEAGRELLDLLQAGSSRHWKDTLFEMTGSSEMSAGPMLNYFKPLRDYLQGYIKNNSLPVGWKPKSSKKAARWASLYSSGSKKNTVSSYCVQCLSLVFVILGVLYQR